MGDVTAASRTRLAGALGVAAPFPWQLALLDRMLAGTLPEAIDVPTGLGKTAVMAVWLVARAAGAPVPRRLVYVVDRRAVVDQATDVATKLREFVSADVSLQASLGLSRPLPISTLRGQFADNKEWLTDPSSPAIVLGTVDMIGSRLLFSGYGVSRKMRPYHAGLLGADSLIVLDEAHLVQPFERLVEQIASGKDAYGSSLRAESGLGIEVPPLRFMSLSATGRSRSGAGVLRLGAEDHENPTVAKRLAAPKRLSLRAEVSDKELPVALAEEAWKLSGEGTKASRIIVFCTSRDHAQKVRDALAKRVDAPVAQVELFVGGRRVYERQQAAAWLKTRGFIAGTEAKPERATFVIATAAGEVGVDLDADHAVCDLVAWERMVQRFGRVNRRGDGDATLIVVPASVDTEHSEQREAVRTLLGRLPRTKDGAVDVSPGALGNLKEDAEAKVLIERASTPAPLHPPLTRALVESWSMTSLEEHTGRPEVAPWIRGWPEEEEDPQTTVVWRRYLPINDAGRLLGRTDLDAFREAADPQLVEKLEIESWRVVDWLASRLATLKAPRDSEAGRERPRREDPVAVVLDGPGVADFVLDGGALSNKDKRDRVLKALAGATLFLDERLGGLSGGLLDEDVELPEGGVLDVTELEPAGEERPVPFRVRRLVEGEGASADGARWRTEASMRIDIGRDDAPPNWLVVESLTARVAESQQGRSGSARAQALVEHQDWTEKEAQQIAERLAIVGPHWELLAVAGLLHDEGKKAARWQNAFGAPERGGPYAKTTTKNINHTLLDGYRHELGSLPYAESHLRVKALPDELRQLCLHLIAAHHGGARPILRTDGAEEPPTRLAERARQIALRFCVLESRWGPWGLAWWESLLRAADQAASRRNDQEGGAHG